MTYEAIKALTSRSAAHYIQWYFANIGEPFTVERFKKISDDELMEAYISIKTVIEIQKLQIQLG